MARFFDAPPWRFVVTRLDGTTLTFLDPRALNRTVGYVLNQPAVATLDVPSDDPEINILDIDGDPFVSRNNRLLYGFRRDGLYPNPPWTVRFSGLLMQPNDEITATVDAAITHVTAFDPWQYLKSRPVLNSFGLLPSKNGISFSDEPQNIVKALLTYAVAGGPPGGPASSSQCYIDFGQTAFYGGNINTVHITPEVEINFRQGMDVGSAFDQLVATGACDIVLTPIYDPIRRPGLLCEVNVYQLAGNPQNTAAVFSWDKPGRSLNGLNRLQDGSLMANVAQFYAGQGGAPVTQETDAASLAKFGQFWLQKFYPGLESTPELVELLAKAQVQLLNKGKETVAMDPAPEFAPLLFEEYFLGDQVPVYASSNFRLAINPTLTSRGWENLYRIYGIPVVIPDDAPESVSNLLLTSPFS